MYLTPTANHWVIDIETDGLDPTCVWVLCATNAVTKEERTCETYEAIRKFIDETTGCYYVGHNILSFDIPVLNRLVGTRIATSRLVDTFLLSSLYSPSLAGGHSLDAWGERFGQPKVKHDEWHEYSEAMLGRCKGDVALNLTLFNKLTTRMKKVGFTERGCEIEHKAWRIIQKQKKNGFFFNYRQAHELFVELRAKGADLEAKIHERFPPELKHVATYKKANKADGTPTAGFERHTQEYERLEVQPDGTYRAFGYVHFNLGSPLQRIEKLQALGWVPREYTKPSKSFPEGQPKATEHGELVPSLQEFAEESGIEEVTLIAQWITVNNRANMINNWMEAYDDGDGCIHGNLWLANTLRYRHDKPNTANIPAVRTGKDDKPLLGEAGWWTYEARDCWQTRDPAKRRLVGVDAKGIQLRVLAHYLNNSEFTANILKEDPHSANQELFELPTRSLTKTITYATLMGAGDNKVATEANLSMKEAAAVKRKFFAKVPELPRLIKRLKRELEQTGRITLCDGSKVLVSSPHMVIPYLLQGDESRIMKQAAIYVDEGVRRDGLDVLKVGDIHDEWQNDVYEGDVERFIVLCESAFRRAGESFNYNLPIECDAKVGFTWAETH
jgi:DNA polymerase-1